ncbi:MAG: two-component system phosphate regulon sensor histidine kinase PhoR [Arenicella sp.]
MSKNRIKILIALMSAAIVGLLLLQFFWITDVHHQTTHKFEEDVRSCLNKTMIDLEHSETMNLISPDAYQQGLQGSYTDFVKSEFGEVMSAKEAIVVRDTVIYKDGNPMHFLVVTGTSIDTATGLRAEHKVITKNLGEITQTNIENSVLGLNDTNAFAIQLNKSFESQIMNKANHINEMMMKIFAGNFFDDITLRLNPFLLDSLMSRNLTSLNIDTSFSYNVLDKTGEPIHLKYASSHYDSTITSRKYKADLYPNDIVSGGQHIIISFPEQNLMVWKTMTGTLVGSILLVLIVLFAFFFAVSTIFKQKKLSEIKNDFISNMTHELKTPISTISLACEAAKDPDVGADEAAVQSFITMIDQENKRLGKLVENVLQTALIDKGKLKLNLEEVALNKMVNETVNTFQIRFKDNGGDIQIRTLDKITWDVDKIHFGNILFNLLDNALKYCKEAPKAIIDLRKTKKGFELAIEDNGIGIEKENQKKIFEKLYRVPTGNVHNVKGFGLGLNYVNAVIDLHEGQIDVVSELGEGSIFKITMNHE